MPMEAHFRRDHFTAPTIDPAAWRLRVEGLVERRLELSLPQLQAYPRRDLPVVLECAGHRRSELRPQPAGLPWEAGAVSEADWSGTSLADILGDAGVREGRFVVLEGAVEGPFREHGNVTFARALPIDKALDPDTLLAWEMNGEPLPLAHGAPVRAVVPGWYATDSVKWLTRITVLDRPFTGPFEAIDYRLSPPPDTGDSRLTALAVHSLITSVADRERIREGAHVVRGIAWGGEGGIAQVDVSVGGSAWQPAALTPARGRYGRTHWSFTWPARSGLRTLAVRATDGRGDTQPLEASWNEGGYANASVHQIRVLVGADVVA
jgi:sulfite oxidase